jgi:hypothetical protein
MTRGCSRSALARGGCEFVRDRLGGFLPEAADALQQAGQFVHETQPDAAVAAADADADSA